MFEEDLVSFSGLGECFVACCPGDISRYGVFSIIIADVWLGDMSIYELRGFSVIGGTDSGVIDLNEL